VTPTASTVAATVAATAPPTPARLGGRSKRRRGPAHRRNDPVSDEGGGEGGVGWRRCSEDHRGCVSTRQAQSGCVSPWHAQSDSHCSRHGGGGRPDVVRGKEDEQLLCLVDLASQGIGRIALTLSSEGGHPHARMAFGSSSTGSGEGSGEGGVWRRWWGKAAAAMASASAFSAAWTSSVGVVPAAAMRRRVAATAPVGGLAAPASGTLVDELCAFLHA